MLVLIATTLLLLLSSVVEAVTPVKRVGTRFFYDKPKGDQFFLKGVVYVSPSTAISSDVLSFGVQCEIDAPLIKALGANTISFNRPVASADHDKCMAAFAANGIYVLVIVEDDENKLHSGLTSSLLREFTSIVDAFQKYNNTLGFIVDNRGVSAGGKTLGNALTIKSAVRDLKTYIRGKNYRQIPVGSNVNKMDTAWNDISNYYACQIPQGQDDNSVDFIGLQHYSTCETVSFYGSDFDQISEQYGNWNTPVFFAEKGCSEVAQQRTFDDQAIVFGPYMNNFFSGSVMFEWANTDSDYGLVNYTGTAIQGTPTPKTDFSILSSVWATVSPVSITNPGTTSVPTITCPTYASSTWPLSANSLVTAAGIENVATITNTGIITSSPTATSGAGTNPNDESANGSSTSLSTGAIAGIGVGIGIFVLLLVAGIWIHRRSRRRRQLNPPNYQASDYYGDNWKGEMYAGPVDIKKSGPVKIKAEMTGVGVTERLMSSELGHDTQTPPVFYELNASNSVEMNSHTHPTRSELSPRPFLATENDSIEQNRSPTPTGTRAATIATTPTPSPTPVMHPTIPSKKAQPPDFDEEELAGEADIAVQELGLISVRKRALIGAASAARVDPENLPGRKGEEYKELLLREERTRGRLEEIEKQRRTISRI